jgi:hypothetical protein
VGELRFPSETLPAPSVAGAEIRLAELVPRAGDARRFLFGFATGGMVSVEPHGDKYDPPGHSALPPNVRSSCQSDASRLCAGEPRTRFESGAPATEALCR